MKTVPALGHDQVLAAIDAIRRALQSRGKAAVIAIADSHGELLALLRMDGAPLSSVQVASNKAYTAARLSRPTRVLGATLRERGTDIAFYGDPRYTGFGGGLPVLIDGTVVGSVALSGLSDAEDEELAALGVAVLQQTEKSAHDGSTKTPPA
ncbi:MAG TPA: heme-binding protein [Casimicrobiaceae bacterium]|nr:heme-binding protein [Casimicrobiaceae bacterium]